MNLCRRSAVKHYGPNSCSVLMSFFRSASSAMHWNFLVLGGEPEGLPGDFGDPTAGRRHAAASCCLAGRPKPLLRGRGVQVWGRQPQAPGPSRRLRRGMLLQTGAAGRLCSCWPQPQGKPKASVNNKLIRQ